VHQLDIKVLITEGYFKFLRECRVGLRNTMGTFRQDSLFPIEDSDRAHPEWRQKGLLP